MLIGHSAILTGLVIGRNGSPGDAPPNVLFPAFCELLSNHLPRGGGSGESRGRRIGSLPGDFGPPWTELSEVWVPGWTYFHNSDKEFALTMGGGCGMLEGGRHGAGEGYKEPEGGREADSPTKYPNELIKIYKD